MPLIARERPAVAEKSKTVYVAIRNTRTGPKRLGVFDNSREAHEVAQAACDEAAGLYGSASTDVFRARLTLIGKPQVGRRG